MLTRWRFIWRATQGHRFRPWRSPYLRWRVETFSGLDADHIRARDFFRFCWRERRGLARFLAWTGEMDKHRRHSLHPVQSGHAGPDPNG
ncbi:MAG TPA: hypothetical protein VN515_03310 [Terriglobales bacterium]|nr:hypothetical protein [Terriglobales bacterium]